MTNRIRGKKRQEVIDNWLKGIEDPDIEVKPTKKENRYIVRSKSTSREPEQNTEEEPIEESIEEVSNKHINNNKRKESSESESHEVSSDEYEYDYEYEEPNKSELLQYEILNELKRMNEEKAARRAEKQRKKDIKHQVQHQLYKQQLSASIAQPDRPAPQRRRINLLNRLL